MNARLLPATFVLALAAGASGAAPAPQGQPVETTPLRPIGECMIARHVRDWGVVDRRRVVVRTLGERYYDVTLRHACSAMLRRPLLSFSDSVHPLPLGSGRGFRRGVGMDPVVTDGRICGDFGESVIAHGGTWTGSEIPCRIDSVRRIDRQAFEGVFGRTPEEARDWLDASPTLVPQANASR